MDNISWKDSFELDLVVPVPPDVPPPPPPAWKCSLSQSATCFEVPSTAPGPVYATQAECARSCVLCNLTGTWLGSEPGIPISIESVAITNVSALITVSAPAAHWAHGNATGVERISSIAVSGGWCASTCLAIVSSLDASGPPCAMISWGSTGSWCNPAADSRCTYGGLHETGRLNVVGS